MGKGIAVVLMLVGVALLGPLAANLASILISGLHDDRNHPPIHRSQRWSSGWSRWSSFLEKLQPSDEDTHGSQIPESD